VVHLNNAGASLVPQQVLDAEIAHLHREAEIGAYEAKAEAAERIEGVYRSIARLIGAAPAEIALVESATAAWNAAFSAFRFRPGDRILTGEAEYASNYINFLLARERNGVEIDVIASDASGQIDVGQLERSIDERVKLIAITHVPTNGGLVNPAAAIGRVARAAGVPYLLDACQSVGQLQIDVDAIGCDLLSATGRKFLRGPRGTGFLYVRRSLLDKLEPATLDLHAAEWVAPDRYVMRPDARRFEFWEFNHAGLLGLGAAVDYALKLGMEAIENRVLWLGKRLRFILSEYAKLPVYDLGEAKCALVTFTVPDRSAEQVKADLAKLRINVSVSDRPSTLLDATRRGLPELVRASPHYYNTEEDDFGKLTKALRDTRRG
jgi:selenocysteine lyase/cysteine desulfurase